MRSNFRFVFVVFYLTAILIFTVYLRNSEDRLFYQISVINAEQSRLKQQLANKQLQLESLINPAAIIKQIKQEQ